jgi:CRISPR/Cas system-associated protein endoribonuclease Cas2
MSRNKKSRSLKRVTGGVKTGTKERTKLENKQNKARKKALTTTGKVKRQRSIYQKMVDENGTDEKQVAPKKTVTQQPDNTEIEASAETRRQTQVKEEAPITPAKSDIDTSSDEDLWDQLENPGESNTF